MTLSETPTRHTALGELPIDVNSIDQLDQALGLATRKILLRERELSELRQSTNAAVWYARAHTARRKARAAGESGEGRGREWREARDNYDLEQQP